MERFKRLTTVEPNTWNPDSPVEWIKGAILLANSTGKILLQLKLCNISDKHIKSVHLLIDGFDEMGESLCKDLQFSYQDINQAPHTIFGEQTPIYLPDERIRKVQIHFSKVMFADGTIAAVEDKKLSIPDRKSITDWPDNLVNELNRVYADNNDTLPLAYVPKEFTDTWLCSCGKINVNKQEHCKRCGRDRNSQLKVINRDYLLDSLQKYHNQLETQKIEAENKLEEERKLHQQRNERFRKKFRKFAVFAVFLIVVGISIFSVHSIIQHKQAEEAHSKLLQSEENTYKTAVSLYNSTDYRKSIPLLRKIGNYKNSSKYAQLAQNKLQNLLAAGTFHTVGIKSDGTLLSAGNSDNFKQYPALKNCGQYNIKDWKNIVSIIPDVNFTVGLKKDGTIAFAGNIKYSDGLSNIKNWKDVIQITGEDGDIYGLKKDGTIVCTIDQAQINDWGNSNYTKDFVGYFVDIKDKVPDWKNITNIFGEEFHVVALRNDGTVVSAGENLNGECDVSLWKNIISISTTSNYTFGLKSDGTVVKVGKDQIHPLPDISTWKDIVAISSSDSHVVGVKADGTVIAVGDDKQNECEVSDWKDIIAVKADSGYTIGLKSDGSVVSTSSEGSGVYANSMNWNLFK